VLEDVDERRAARLVRTGYAVAMAAAPACRAARRRSSDGRSRLDDLPSPRARSPSPVDADGPRVIRVHVRNRGTGTAYLGGSGVTTSGYG
jgi:hypothetical protein